MKILPLIFILLSSVHSVWAQDTVLPSNSEKPGAEQAETQKPDTIAGVGQPAPLFTVKDMNGVERRLESLRGKKNLLLTFFPRCFTGNCASQLSSLRDNYDDLQKAGVEVWAASTDPAEGEKGQRAFARHLKLPFPLLPDTRREISLLYGAVQSREQMAARMSIFIDTNGTVLWIDKQINPRTHGEDVLRQMQEQNDTTPPER